MCKEDKKWIEKDSDPVLLFACRISRKGDFIHRFVSLLFNHLLGYQISFRRSYDFFVFPLFFVIYQVHIFMWKRFSCFRRLHHFLDKSMFWHHMEVPHEKNSFLPTDLVWFSVLTKIDQVEICGAYRGLRTDRNAQAWIRWTD